jgi:hypothetical protein
MVKHMRTLISSLALLVSAGCATMPTGPSVMVLPGTGKSFEQFQTDDAVCRQWAIAQTGQTPQEVANKDTATGSVAGTLIGAGLGAAIGAASGSPGVGAAIGAGSGLLVGTAAGAGAGQSSGWSAQHRYDNAYQQCMYAKGNQIPGVPQRTQHIQRVPPPPPGPGTAPPPSYQPYSNPEQ